MVVSARERLDVVLAWVRLDDAILVGDPIRRCFGQPRKGGRSLAVTFGSVDVLRRNIGYIAIGARARPTLHLDLDGRDALWPVRCRTAIIDPRLLRRDGRCGDIGDGYGARLRKADGIVVGVRRRPAIDGRLRNAIRVCVGCPVELPRAGELSRRRRPIAVGRECKSVVGLVECGVGLWIAIGYFGACGSSRAKSAATPSVIEDYGSGSR